MELRKIAPDVYTMQHPFGSSNSSFVVTPDGVLVFDADIRTADQTMAAIRKTTDKKVQLCRDLASVRRPRHRRLAFPRGQAARHRLAQADARPLPAGARRVPGAARLNRRAVRGLQGRRAGASRGRLRRRADAAVRRADVPDHRGRQRPFDQRRHDVRAAAARDDDGRPAQHRNPSRPRRVGAGVLLQCAELDHAARPHHRAAAAGRHLYSRPRPRAYRPRRRRSRGAAALFHRHARRGVEDDHGRQERRGDPEGIRDAEGIRALQGRRSGSARSSTCSITSSWSAASGRESLVAMRARSLAAMEDMAALCPLWACS